MCSSSSVVEFDVVAAGLSGDLAYFVGYKRALSSIDGGAAEGLGLRITQVCRREVGEWKLVRRHADPCPATVRAPTIYGRECAISTTVSHSVTVSPWRWATLHSPASRR